MSKRIGSRSYVQRDIEEYLIKRVREELGNIVLDSNPDIKIDKDGKTFIRPDFFSEEEKIIGEIHSHVGRLKAAQQNKIAGDVLKMILYDKYRRDTFKKYLVVCSEEEFDQLKGTSYLAEAIRQYKIELMYIKLPNEEEQRLSDAMKKQNLMEKPSMTASPHLNS